MNFNYEEFISVVKKFANLFSKVIRLIKAAADGISSLIKAFQKTIKFIRKNEGILKTFKEIGEKRYGRNVEERQKSYNYIPLAKKNLPYMRRNY